MTARPNFSLPVIGIDVSAKRLYREKKGLWRSLVENGAILAGRGLSTCVFASSGRRVHAGPARVHFASVILLKDEKSNTHFRFTCY